MEILKLGVQMTDTDKLVIANVSGFLYGLSIQLARREPEISKVLLDKCKRLDNYLEPPSDPSND